MITFNNAQNALKSVYLDVVAEQLNVNSNALMSKIEKSTKNVYGKDVIKTVTYGLNGAIGARDELDNVPTAQGRKYLQFKSELKNLYGSISISDKAIKASKSNKGAFVNLLNEEMESLIKSGSFQIGRMLYGDGSGKLATVIDSIDSTTIKVDSVKNIVEGTVIDCYMVELDDTAFENFVITYVDRVNNEIHMNRESYSVEGQSIFAADSKDKEITGIKRIFDTTEPNKMLYGVDRTQYKWLYPYINNNGGVATEINDMMIQTALNNIEETSGNQPDFIAVSGSVRNAYQAYLSAFRRNIDVETLAGGYKAITYAGIPMVYERFIDDGKMYLLNTKDFAIHQLGDWEWLEGENGNVLIPSSTNSTYTAILAKYCELLCSRPGAQGMISNIKSTVNTYLTDIAGDVATLNSNYATVNATTLNPIEEDNK